MCAKVSMSRKNGEVRIMYDPFLFST